MPRDSFSIQTPESLRAFALELQRVAASYLAVATDWEELQISGVPVKGEAERARALNGAEAFAKNARSAMWVELARRKIHGEPISREQAKKLLEGPRESVSDSVSDSPPKKLKK